MEQDVTAKHSVTEAADVQDAVVVSPRCRPSLLACCVWLDVDANQFGIGDTTSCKRMSFPRAIVALHIPPLPVVYQTDSESASSIGQATKEIAPYRLVSVSASVRQFWKPR